METIPEDIKRKLKLYNISHAVADILRDSTIVQYMGLLDRVENETRLDSAFERDCADKEFNEYYTPHKLIYIENHRCFHKPI